ncbi:hypothetical protein DNTS_015628 [Danionella cerebrum]|uniref:BTB domain-containing protein n=1 Tax=Danionella cerebrum TaxID=2873325 RepID=A0A553QKK4_9TELE|nr:hypothetical protein DNTS_015628 [Danionella translucida]
MIRDSSCRAELFEDSASLLSLDSSVFFSEPALPSEDPLDFFIINVGGSRYILSQELLASHPETRLGKLALSSRDSALNLCDDADLLENEFFFDRNSQTFQYIMNFYKTGHLHVREELCVISFLQEIEYWGIDELRIDSCCRDKYYRRKEMKESLDVCKDTDLMDKDEEDFTGVLCQDIRQRLWDLMEKPDSSKAAKTFGTLSMFFVVVSIVNMALISLDIAVLGAPIILDTLEYICIVWFTGELVVRFICVRDKCKFSRSVVNIIDLLAILPFYVTLAVESLHGESTELENVGRVVQVLRLMRSLRMLKLGRHSTASSASHPRVSQTPERSPASSEAPSSYRSARSSPGCAGSWTIQKLRQELARINIQPSRKSNKAELLRLYQSHTSASPRRGPRTVFPREPCSSYQQKGEGRHPTPQRPLPGSSRPKDQRSVKPPVSSQLQDISHTPAPLSGQLPAPF